MNTANEIANNPLLDFSDLPRFAEIRPEHVTPAIDHLLSNSQQTLARLEQDHTPATWQDFVAPLEDSTEQLSRAWGMVGHLNAVMDTPELRAAFNANLPKVTEFWTALSQNLQLFNKYKALANSAEFNTLNTAKQRIVNNALRDFRLGGAELSEEKKPRFAEIQEQQAALSTKFSENVLDATNQFAHYVEAEADLAGLPDDVIQAARASAERDGKPGWKFTMHYPSYSPVLQYADKRSLREAIYRANATRASELGDAAQGTQFDNTANIIEILKLRDEEAHLLDYQNFSEVSLVPKMAQSPQEVMDFLRDLAKRARPFAEKDLAEVKAFAANELGLEKLEAWDIAYASEKLREQRYAFSEQEVKQYFPEPKVIEGLFKVIETLFSVHIKPDTGSTWHKDAHFYRIETHQGQLVGQFYLDLYAREGKRGGAWMDDARTRKRKVDGAIQTPIAYLTCNFSGPVGNKPALFTHDEVNTLFHEFGHGLHHMLTKVEELGVSGINGVEWDAVELPSQFMENFCWEWDVIKHMTAHVDTGAALPKALFDKMLAAKNFQNGLQTLRQIEFSLFDMRLHTEFDPGGVKSVQQLLDEVRDEVTVNRPPSFNRFQNTFSHIFAGGYAAGYFSYKWAEVLSADAFAYFEEHGVLSESAGHRFLHEILEVGGSRPAMESFKAFRGREPKIDALLRHGGMA